MIPIHSYIIIVMVGLSFLMSHRVSTSDPLPTEPTDSSMTTAVVAPAFASLAKNELLQLEDNITLESWRRLNPNDSLVFFKYEDSPFAQEEWCVRAERRYSLRSSKQTAVRRAYFYVPLPARGLILPTLNDSIRVRMNEPVLGLIWIEVKERSRQAGIIIRDSVRTRLTDIAGPIQVDPKLYGYGTTGWTHTSYWSVGTKRFATGYDVPQYQDGAPAVVACAYLPISNFSTFEYPEKYSVGGQESRHDSILFERTLGLLGPIRQEAGELLRVYTNVLRHPNGYSDTSGVLVSLARWISICARADRLHRAAGLLLADRVLHVVEASWDRSTVARFQQIGATIVESRTMGWIYERSWLQQALALDPDGPVGELSWMILIQEGFKIQADCHGCGQCFGRVIMEGERFLRRTNDPDLRGWAHLTLGHAYSDVVALASGWESYANEDSPIQIAPNAARVQALEHFRQAFAYDTSTSQVRRAWRLAWRLTACIPPDRPFFVCSDE